MRFIIPILVGSIIGYITNWLAIKMLFRPLCEKRIFGIKIPFTPGLIPKERSRIAKSVGEAVGEHILSPDVISKALYKDAFESKFRELIKEKYFALKDKNESINDLLQAKDKIRIYTIILNLSNSITDSIMKQLHIDELKNKAIEYIVSKGDALLKSEDTKRYLNQLIYHKLEEAKGDQRKIKEVLSGDVLAEIGNLLEKNKSNIGNSVKSIFDDPVVRDRISTSVSIMVEQNISKVITMFISPEQISEKILQVVEKYINDPKSHDDYIVFIKNGLNSLMEMKLANAIAEVDILFNEDRISKISSHIINDIKLNDIKNQLSDNLEIIISSKVFRDEIVSLINNIFIEVLNKPISLLMTNINEEIFDELLMVIRTLIEKNMVNDLPILIETFNISKIIEDQINSFDVEYTEKLILDIANKELKAITWLGALLGAIMGILTPILQML